MYSLLSNLLTKRKMCCQSSVLKINGFNICKKLKNPVLREAKNENQMGKYLYNASAPTTRTFRKPPLVLNQKVPYFMSLNLHDFKFS